MFVKKYILKKKKSIFWRRKNLYFEHFSHFFHEYIGVSLLILYIANIYLDLVSSNWIDWVDWNLIEYVALDMLLASSAVSFQKRFAGLQLSWFSRKFAHAFQVQFSCISGQLSHAFVVFMLSLARFSSFVGTVDTFYQGLADTAQSPPVMIYLELLRVSNSSHISYPNSLSQNIRMAISRKWKELWEIDWCQNNCFFFGAVFNLFIHLIIPRPIYFTPYISPSECEVPVPGIFNFFGGIGTGIGKNWYRKKVSEPVSEKFGTGKKSRNRYRKNLVPELIFVAKILEFRWFLMGTGTGIGNFSFFLVVSEKFGTGKKSRNRYR